MSGLILTTAGVQTGIVASSTPGFQDGVTGFSGGTALVGERGPELVTFGRGANVITNENTNRLLANAQGNGDGGTTYNFNAPITVQANNPEEFAEQAIETQRFELAR
jgi:hypothetical protein